MSACFRRSFPSVKQGQRLPSARVRKSLGPSGPWSRSHSGSSLHSHVIPMGLKAAGNLFPIFRRVTLHFWNLPSPRGNHRPAADYSRLRISWQRIFSSPRKEDKLEEIGIQDHQARWAMGALSMTSERRRLSPSVRHSYTITPLHVPFVDRGLHDIHLTRKQQSRNGSPSTPTNRGPRLVCLPKPLTSLKLSRCLPRCPSLKSTAAKRPCLLRPTMG